MSDLLRETPGTHRITRTATFVAVWIALVALTGTTVAVASLHAGRASMIVPILISSIKTSLVLLFFMHLKDERRLFKLLFLAPIITLTVIIVLTFSDIWYR